MLNRSLFIVEIESIYEIEIYCSPYEIKRDVSHYFNELKFI